MRSFFLIFALLVSVVYCSAQASDASLSPLSVHPIHQAMVNGIDYHYIDQGEGEVIFFLHGFPDLANTWDDAISEMSGQYRCIAPFLRGYYPSGIAPDGDYASKTIATDIRELATQLGIEKYYVVGHDWGASVTYSLANLDPERVQKIVTIAIPHPSFIKITPRAAIKARHFLRFRNAKSSLDYTRKNDMAYIDKLYKRWAPGWKDYQAVSQQVKATFRMEGRLEAALGYYWTLNAKSGDKSASAFSDQLPTMPVMALAGKRDGALLMRPFYKMKKEMPASFRLGVHDEAGHFLHREAPAYFLKMLREFLSE